MVLVSQGEPPDDSVSESFPNGIFTMMIVQRIKYGDRNLCAIAPEYIRSPHIEKCIGAYSLVGRSKSAEYIEEKWKGAGDGVVGCRHMVH